MRTLPELIGCISRVEGLDNTEDEHSLNRSSDGGHWSMSSQQEGWRESKAEEDRGRQRKTEQDRERDSAGHSLAQRNVCIKPDWMWTGNMAPSGTDAAYL